MQYYFDDDKLLIISFGYEGSYFLSREKSHNQIITHEYYTEEKVIEKRYYISSLLRNIATFSEAIRGHWKVENKLHWQMDYTF